MAAIRPRDNTRTHPRDVEVSKMLKELKELPDWMLEKKELTLFNDVWERVQFNDISNKFQFSNERIFDSYTVFLLSIKQWINFTNYQNYNK